MTEDSLQKRKLLYQNGLHKMCKTEKIARDSKKRYLGLQF